MQLERLIAALAPKDVVGRAPVELSDLAYDAGAVGPGALFFWYVGLYSVGRFAIESLRLDSFWAGGYRVPQLASLAGIAISLCGLLWVRQGTRGGTRAA